MSSTTNSTSTFVDPQAQSSQELVDDLGLNINHYSTTPFDNNLLSPFNHSQTISNSASPSYNISSTPGDSFSDYSNYEPSEIEDEFFGVNFDAGVQRIDSLPSTLLGHNAYQPVDLNRALPELPPHVESKPSPGTVTTSTYPLSPIHSSLQNTPSPNGAANDLKNKTTISQHELTTDLHNSRYQAPTHPTSIQLTPDHSGSSHTSAEGLEPGTMSHPEPNHNFNGGQWGNDQSQPPPNQFAKSDRQYGSASNTNQTAVPSMQQGTVLRDEEDGRWRSDERTGQAGLDPESRKLYSNKEVPSLKQQEEKRRIENKNMEVREWRSQAGGSSDAEDEMPDESYFPLNNEEWPEQADSDHARNPPESDNGVLPADDVVRTENRLVEGQVYYNFKNAVPNDADMELLNQPRQLNDPPSLPYITTTAFQAPTANDAIMKWNGQADTFSLASRVATWGTRRRSEPSLSDYESVIDGSFLKKLSVTKPEVRGHRQNSIFDQGLDRLANIVRKRSDSKLKRARSTQNIPEEAQGMSHPRNNSHGTLAPPARTSSFGKRSTPSINTAFAAMTAPLAAVGTTHARSGSVTCPTPSPKSPTRHLGFARSVIKRARSRSELSSQEKAAQPGIVDLWRVRGGPPVANLASPPIKTEVKQQQPEPQDDDEDEDDDDEQGEERDLKMESEQEADPIIPNYEGFKSHVRRLNPEMETRYQWLVSRIAHQQEIRYKNLLDLRVKHQQATAARICAAGHHCVTLGGHATLLDAKGNPRDSEQTPAALQLVTDFSDDSNPGEGALTDETFPQGVPMPPTRNLPAEFECQLCFKAKKFQKPSDWTKHVHEDVQPFTCTYDKCKEPKSFKRKADWVRHENERHRHLEWWICQVDDCRHPCYRKDNFLQHLVREHKLPEPKQKTKAAIKKARLTEPAWVMLEQCHHETGNTPQDEPCKFCGKTFTSWKKLTVHLAKHMEHISLPILRLVEQRNVDANTIISPVEQILTPVTPISRAKMESNSPFNMDSISPHVPMVQQFTTTSFNQPAYFQTTGSTTGYGMHPPMPQEVAYDQSHMFPDAFGGHQMDQPRVFGSLDSGGLGHVDQTRPYGSMDAGFPEAKVEQRPYGSLDANFSHTVPDQSYNSHQSSRYSMSQNYVSGPPAVSGYQTPNMLGISQGGYDFDPMTVNAGQNFQQVPMSRAPGSASSYGHSPQNGPYYGHQ
jgi:hypothetical protein